MYVSEYSTGQDSPFPAVVAFKTDRLEDQLFYYLSNAYCDFEKIDEVLHPEIDVVEKNIFAKYIWNGMRMAIMMYIEAVVKFDVEGEDVSGVPTIYETSNMWHDIAREKIRRVFEKPTFDEGAEPEDPEKVRAEPEDPEKVLWDAMEPKRSAFFSIYTVSKLAEMIVNLTRPLPLGRTYDHPGASVGKAISNLAGMILFSTMETEEMTSEKFGSWIQGDIATGSSTHHPAATVIAYHHAKRGSLTEEFVAFNQTELWNLTRTILNFIGVKVSLDDENAYLAQSSVVQSMEGKSGKLAKMCENHSFTNYSKITGLDQSTINALPTLSYAPTSFAVILTESCLLLVSLWKDTVPLKDNPQAHCPVIRRHVKRFPLYSMEPRVKHTTHSFEVGKMVDPEPQEFLHHEADGVAEIHITRHLTACTQLWKKVDAEVRKYTLSIFQCVENLATGLRRYTDHENCERLKSSYGVAQQRIAPAFYKRGQFNSTKLLHDLKPIPADPHERADWFNSVEKRKGQLRSFGNTVGLMNLLGNHPRSNISVQSEARELTPEAIKYLTDRCDLERMSLAFEVRDCEPITTKVQEKMRSVKWFVNHNAPDCGGRPPTSYAFAADVKRRDEVKLEKRIQERIDARRNDVISPELAAGEPTIGISIFYFYGVLKKIVRSSQ
jgi:hypothetical protein